MNLALANSTNNSTFLLMKFDCKALVCCSIWRVCFYAGVKCTLVGSTAGGWKSMKGTVFALFGDDWLCLMKDTGLYRAGRGKLHRKVCEYTQRFSGFLFVNCKSYTEIPTCSLLALTAQYKIYMLCKIPQERKKKKISRDLFNVPTISQVTFRANSGFAQVSCYSDVRKRPFKASEEISNCAQICQVCKSQISLIIYLI